MANNNTIPLALLLRIDDKFDSHAALPLALGDRYLYATSHIFMRIRDTVTEMGYRFVREESGIWHAYQALPLLSLRDIIETKQIPYFDNVTTVRDVVKHQPGIEFPLRFLLSTLKKNYLLHESSHCVACGLLQQRGNGLSHFGSEQERFVVTTVLSEAFANTMERLATSVAGAKSQALFLAMNSYMDYRNDRRELLSQALDKVGIDAMFRLIFLTYWRSNLQTVQLPPETMDAIIDRSCRGVVVAEGDRKALHELMNREFSLNIGFREDTSATYFRFYDCEREFTSLSTGRLIEDAFLDDAMPLISEFAELVLPLRPVPVPSAERLQAVGQT